VDHWATQVKPGVTLTVPVSIANDGSSPWRGAVRLHLLRAGRNFARNSALFAPPAAEGALKQATHDAQEQIIGPVPLSQQGRANFTLVVPTAPGHFQLMAEITGDEAQPVRSWRDFKTN
jgi:hypothetical protein